MLSRLPIVVRSTEVDTLGHVNNAVYQNWLEWGRFEWVRRAGLDLDAIARRGFALVVVHVSMDYRREARMDDDMVIETALVRVGRRSLTFAQRVVHSRGEVACEAEVVLAGFDTEARRGKAVPATLRPVLEKLRQDVLSPA